MNILGDVSDLTLQELEAIGVGLNTGILWEEALHSALMPITPQTSMASLADGTSIDILGASGILGNYTIIRVSLVITPLLGCPW